MDRCCRRAAKGKARLCVQPGMKIASYSPHQMDLAFPSASQFQLHANMSKNYEDIARQTSRLFGEFYRVKFYGARGIKGQEESVTQAVWSRLLKQPQCFTLNESHSHWIFSSFPTSFWCRDGLAPICLQRAKCNETAGNCGSPGAGISSQVWRGD